MPRTFDITVSGPADSFRLHKFLLSARSPYFRSKLAEAPDTSAWKLPPSIPIEAFRIVLRYLYLGELPRDLVGPGSTVSEEDVSRGIDKLCRQLQIDKLWEAILSIGDRRLARQRHQDEVQRAQAQVEALFNDTVLKHKMVVDTHLVNKVKWPHDNAIFANCLLRADNPGDEEETAAKSQLDIKNSIPVGPGASTPAQDGSKKQSSILFPVHKAFLIRSPYFETMFSSEFKEAQEAEHLRIIKVDCTPEVLEIILRFLYTEKADCPLEHALDLLYTADMLLLDKLKTKAAVTISTLGSGASNALVDRTHQHQANNSGGEGTDDHRDQQLTAAATAAEEPQVEVEMEPINVYDIIHAAWDLKVQRLEEFAARYLASRLEDYIDEPEFADLIQESAARLKDRHETDTIELLDDIRYYLSERFRLRFEGEGIEEMLDENGEVSADGVNDIIAAAAGHDWPESQPRPPTAGNGEAGKGGVVTLNGAVVEDEFDADTVNYQILLAKIDKMLDQLKLDA